MLPIGNAKLFGGLLHNPGQRSVVGVAHERAQMMGDVVVEPAGEPAYERVFCRVIGRRGEDVVDAVVEFAAVRGKVSAVDSVSSLEDQRYGHTDDQMNQHERQRDQQNRFSKQDHRQNEHVGEVECLSCEQDCVFAQRMFGAFQIVVGREEKGFKVPDEYVVERKQRIKEQRIDMLKAVHARAGFMGRKPKNASAGERVVFAVEIDAGVVAAMMENAPHVRADSADIEDIIQELVYGGHGRDGVVVAVVGDVQQEECLGEAAQEVEGNKLP